MPTRLFSLPLVAFSIITIVVAGPTRAAADTYRDGATSQWFKSLTSVYAKYCCDQSDCKRAMADYRNGAWWALSNRTGQWVHIEDAQVTSTVSIFSDAVLCEGEPAPGSTEARVFCFAPPPIAF
jgi:hypothetical protein